MRDVFPKSAAWRCNRAAGFRQWPSSNTRYGTPMNPSFAQLRRTLYGIACACSISTVALAQDAGLELAAARQAVERATQADADQYAPDRLDSARQQLEQAQRAAMDKREKKLAPAMAKRAEVDADLARALSEEAVAAATLRQRQSEVEQLQHALSEGEGH